MIFTDHRWTVIGQGSKIFMADNHGMQVAAREKDNFVLAKTYFLRDLNAIATVFILLVLLPIFPPAGPTMGPIQVSGFSIGLIPNYAVHVNHITAPLQSLGGEK